MKKLLSNFRFAAAGGDGNGPGTPPPAPKTETADSGLKRGLVKVRNNTMQPINIDGVALDTKVLDAKGKTVKEASVVIVSAKHLKRLGDMVTQVSLLLGLLLLGSFTARAQQYNPTAPSVYFGGLNGGTNIIAAATTNTYNAKLGLTKYDEVALELSFAYTGAGTGVQTFNLVPSNDGVAKATTGQVYSFAVAGNGTNTVDLLTNLYVGAPGYLILTTGANTNATLVATNVLARAVPKPSRRGN